MMMKKKKDDGDDESIHHHLHHPLHPSSLSTTIIIILLFLISTVMASCDGDLHHRHRRYHRHLLPNDGLLVDTASSAALDQLSFKPGHIIIPSSPASSPPRLRGSTKHHHPHPHRQLPPLHPQTNNDTDTTSIFTSYLHWTSESGSIMLNGQRFRLKGINWFGCDTPTL